MLMKDIKKATGGYIHTRWTKGKRCVCGAGEERRQHVISTIELFRSILVKERQER
jgi:hypothetical protein